jgi:hypothetical protein
MYKEVAFNGLPTKTEQSDCCRYIMEEMENAQCRLLPQVRQGLL